MMKFVVVMEAQQPNSDVRPQMNTVQGIHFDRSDAYQEAKRIAKEASGRKVYVYQSVALFTSEVSVMENEIR